MKLIVEVSGVLCRLRSTLSAKTVLFLFIYLFINTCLGVSTTLVVFSYFILLLKKLNYIFIPWILGSDKKKKHIHDLYYLWVTVTFLFIYQTLYFLFLDLLHVVWNVGGETISESLFGKRELNNWGTNAQTNNVKEFKKDKLKKTTGNKRVSFLKITDFMR